MTSIPASLNARATILAPRSWPSRPGFATNTRIFFEELKNPPQVDDSFGEDSGGDIKPFDYGGFTLPLGEQRFLALLGIS